MSFNIYDKYKYNGKEYQDELGLNMYDYGNRNYDPAIGRFHNMDRFTEKYKSLTPYHYTINNPVYFIDVKGDSVSVAEKYRGNINTILEKSFGANASKFSYSKSGMLVFNGNVKDLSKDERKAFNELNSLMNSKTTYDVIIEETFQITKTDGNTETINTGPNGTKGDAAVYPSATKDGKGILALHPNSSSFQVNVIDVEYKDGNQKPVNFGDMLLNDGKGPARTFSMFENFWHGIGHLIGGPTNQGKAMEVENLGGVIHKNVVTNPNGTNTYVPASITTKNYNLDHPKNKNMKKIILVYILVFFYSCSNKSIFLSDKSNYLNHNGELFIQAEYKNIKSVNPESKQNLVITNKKGINMYVFSTVLENSQMFYSSKNYKTSKNKLIFKSHYENYMNDASNSGIKKFNFIQIKPYESLIVNINQDLVDNKINNLELSYFYFHSEDQSNLININKIELKKGKAYHPQPF